MTDAEKSKLAYHAASSFKGAKYVPRGYAAASIDASASRLGLHPDPKEREDILTRVNRALAVLFPIVTPGPIEDGGATP